MINQNIRKQLLHAEKLVVTGDLASQLVQEEVALILRRVPFRLRQLERGDIELDDRRVELDSLLDDGQAELGDALANILRSHDAREFRAQVDVSRRQATFEFFEL